MQLFACSANCLCTGHKSATVIPSYTLEATHAAKLDDQNERDRIVSRKLLADISPPGMWTATDDEDRTSNKRRLLTADGKNTLQQTSTEIAVSADIHYRRMWLFLRRPCEKS